MTTEDKTKLNTDEKQAGEVKEEAPQPEDEKISTANQAEKADEAEVTDTKDEKDEAAKDSESGEENPLLKEFSVEVTKDEIEKTFNEAVEKYASELRLPGFRKGKVPVDVIRSRYKEAVTEEVKEKVIQQAVFDKIEKEKMRIISQPEVLDVHYNDGEDLKADVRVELFPEISLPDFDTLKAEIPAADLKGDDYDEAKQIDAVLENNRRQKPVASRAIQDGDYVMYKYQSKILQTKRMTPRKSTHFAVKEDEPTEIMDFYKEIIGKKLEEEFTIKRTYPEDYKKKPWAGKDVEHYIKIESIFEMNKPDLDENFFKQMGVEDEAEFKKKLKEEYDRYAERRLEDKKMKAVIDTVSDAIVFPLPQTMVNQEMTRMLQQGGIPKVDPKDEGAMKDAVENMKKDAERSLRFSFIIEKIKEEHKLDVTTADLEGEYKRIAEGNHVPLKEVRKFYLKKENAEQLKDSLMRDKVMDFLKEKVKIKEI